ncbi:MAG: hypothetical protein Q4G48_03865 [Bacteroidia bacterium]|nr:hypothetical protein [Bacteroidia bacterium]
MKKRIKFLFLSAAFVLALGVSAQTVEPAMYKLGAGILIDVGDGGTMVGPHAKYFFTANHAGEAAVLFGNGATFVHGIYTYNSAFPGVNGLSWYVGAGPSVAFGGGTTLFSLMAPLGVEFVIPKAPIAISVDWRPRYFFYENETYFDASRFGLGLRYTIN